jgi:hypothetical protein
MNNLVVGINVFYRDSYWDPYKEDFMDGHWIATVITGLEDACYKLHGCRQKDLDLDARTFGEANDMAARKSAIDKLIAKLHGYDFHGKLHIMSDKDMDDFADRLEAQGKIVLRARR